MSDPRVCVLTADFGGRDPTQPTPPPGTPSYRVTDGADAPGWITVPGSAGDDPRLAARHVKTHPAQFLPGGFDFVVWTDGSVQITDPSFPQHAVSHLRSSRDVIAAPRHPVRDCVYDEAEACVTLGRYGPAETIGVRAQAVRYRDAGYPAHAGLWATTVLVWRLSALGTSVGLSWFGHIVTMSESDQMSLPVVMANRHLQVRDLAVDLMDNRYFVWSPHET